MTYERTIYSMKYRFLRGLLYYNNTHTPTQIILSFFQNFEVETYEK